jgi:hypothetical protein
VLVLAVCCVWRVACGVVCAPAAPRFACGMWVHVRITHRPCHALLAADIRYQPPPPTPLSTQCPMRDVDPQPTAVFCVGVEGGLTGPAACARRWPIPWLRPRASRVQQLDARCHWLTSWALRRVFTAGLVWPTALQHTQPSR